MNWPRSCLILTSLAALGLVTGATSHAPAQDRSAPWIGTWTGTWAVSPMHDDSGRSFSKQTLRQIIHTSVSGHLARVHVSNEFGTQALTIQDMHIAERSAGSSVVNGTDRQVQFDGHPSITVEPGHTALSDPVAFEVPRLADVVISVYIPETTGPAIRGFDSRHSFRRSGPI